MSKEIIQPNDIIILEKSDPNFWASLSITRINWLRKVAPQLGVDPDKQILGESLRDISQDDVNCFSWAMSQKYFRQESARQSKKDYLTRSANQLETPELPEEIKERIADVREKLKNINWESYEGMQEAKHVWKTEISEWVQEKVKINHTYREAQRYSMEMESKLSKPWNAFFKEQQLSKEKGQL